MLVGHTISDELGVILALDQGVCEFLCRPEAEIVGVSYLDLTCPKDRSWNKIIVDAIDHNGKPVTFQKRYLLPTGVTISCEVQASRLGEGRDRNPTSAQSKTGFHHACVSLAIRASYERDIGASAGGAWG
jgi:PAS domain-containing protein